MPVFDAKRTQRPRRIAQAPRDVESRAGRALGSLGRRLSQDQEGFLLIEVIVSALLVAVVVVGTLNGFDVIQRTSTDQRQHSQAITLAAQSQEQLRSEAASTLETLEASPHVFTQSVGGTTYTVTQSASLQPASGGSSGACNITESSHQSGNAFAITSTVTWPEQLKRKQKAVVASSLITPPTGSVLEVDAYSGPNYKTGVSGVTATVTYTPVGSATPVSVTQTTGSGGCVVFAAIPATKATVSIKEVSGWVNRSGGPSFPPKELTLAPNYTTHFPVVYNIGGAIEAAFQYKGASSYTHELPNNGGTSITETVASDTFVMESIGMNLKPNYEVGSPTYNTPVKKPEEVKYEVIPGKYQATVASQPNLFPFPAEEKGNFWRVYAGDCTENKPEEKAATLAGEVVVSSGATTKVNVPLSYVSLNVYSGSEREDSKLGAGEWKALETTNSWPVTISNLKCAGTTPDNEVAVTAVHTQNTTTGALEGGHLERPFQPFGPEMQLQITAKGKKYTTEKFALNSEAGAVWKVYLGQPSKAEQEAAKKAEETAQKATETERVAKETKTIKEPREAKEAETKAKEKAREEAERKKWKEEEAAKKISKFQRETKEKEQTKAREKREAEEATARKKAEEEEKAKAKTERERELKEEETKRAAREKEEAEESAATKVKVE